MQSIGDGVFSTVTSKADGAFSTATSAGDSAFSRATSAVASQATGDRGDSDSAMTLMGSSQVWNLALVGVVGALGGAAVLF